MEHKDNSNSPVPLIVITLSMLLSTALLTYGYVLKYAEPGERWAMAYNHIMLGLVGGVTLFAACIVFQFIAAYFRYLKSNKKAPAD